jgi:hypothetical protein
MHPPEANSFWFWVTVGLTALGTFAFYVASLLADFLMPFLASLD